MNHGLRSLVHCPGHYSLQVAQFSGRTSYDLNGNQGQPATGVLNLKESPLKTAHDDAERMADKLSRSPEVQRIGQPVFVYHDRTSSRVFIGAFNSPDDPSAVAVRNELLKCAWAVANKKDRMLPIGRGDSTDIMMVPAPSLTDVEVMKAGLQR